MWKIKQQIRKPAAESRLPWITFPCVSWRSLAFPNAQLYWLDLKMHLFNSVSVFQTILYQQRNSSFTVGRSCSNKPALSSSRTARRKCHSITRHFQWGFKTDKHPSFCSRGFIARTFWKTLKIQLYKCSTHETLVDSRKSIWSAFKRQLKKVQAVDRAKDHSVGE